LIFFYFLKAPHCRIGSQEFNPPKNIFEIFTRIDTINGCGDLIFSGHFTHAITSTIFIWNYFGKKFILKYINLFLCCVLFFLIIASRKHYTIDLIIPIYLIPFVYQFYFDHIYQKFFGYNNNIIVY